MAERVTVRVSATSANVGSGFDCLGLALSLTTDVTLTLQSSQSSQSSPPSPAHPLAPMVAVAGRAAYRAAGRPEPRELGMTWQGALPIARGLGASAAARAAGLVGANALMGRDGPTSEGEPLSLDDLLALGASLEGHPDNIAPALFGGLQVTVHEDDTWRHLTVPLPAGLKVVLFVPDFEMPTRQSRRRLPQRLPREDAVFNVGRAALLVAALAQGRWELLDAATQDRLHQPARAELFPALYDIIDAAKEGGAHAAYLSGAGSTVAALATESEERLGGRTSRGIARLMEQAATARGYSGRAIITEPKAEGAQVLEP